jgi:hypothetical protein
MAAQAVQDVDQALGAAVAAQITQAQVALAVTVAVLEQGEVVEPLELTALETLEQAVMERKDTLSSSPTKSMKRIAHIEGNLIVNVSLAQDDAPLEPNTMLESDALAAGYTYKPASTQKVWPTVADFWAEFTSSEQIVIIDSTDSNIRLLLEALRMWRGEVWSDDPRVTNGLDALVAAGIITTERRQEIITN